MNPVGWGSQVWIWGS